MERLSRRSDPLPSSVSERRARRERRPSQPQRGLIQRLLPLPWELWPAEARLLVSLAAFWSLAGLVILASASWWVALREMGDGAFISSVRRSG